MNDDEIRVADLLAHDPRWEYLDGMRCVCLRCTQSPEIRVLVTTDRGMLHRAKYIPDLSDPSTAWGVFGIAMRELPRETVRKIGSYLRSPDVTTMAAKELSRHWQFQKPE